MALGHERSEFSTHLGRLVLGILEEKGEINLETVFTLLCEKTDLCEENSKLDRERVRKMLETGVELEKIAASGRGENRLYYSMPESSPQPRAQRSSSRHR